MILSLAVNRLLYQTSTLSYIVLGYRFEAHQSLKLQSTIRQVFRLGQCIPAMKSSRSLALFRILLLRLVDYWTRTELCVNNKESCCVPYDGLLLMNDREIQAKA